MVVTVELCLNIFGLRNTVKQPVGLFCPVGTSCIDVLVIGHYKPGNAKKNGFLATRKKSLPKGHQVIYYFDLLQQQQVSGIL